MHMKVISNFSSVNKGAMCYIRILFFSGYLTLSIAISGEHGKYPYAVYLDQNKRLYLEWFPNYVTSEVDFRLTGNDVTRDTWLGVGFSDYGETNDADCVIFWTSSKGVHHFQDAHTDESSLLHVDTTQNYQLHRAQSDGHVAVLEFSRKFDTCDDQDYLFDTGTTHIIFFISLTRPLAINGLDLSKLEVGLQRVQLLKPEVHDPPLPEDTWTIEVTNQARTRIDLAELPMLIEWNALPGEFSSAIPFGKEGPSAVPSKETTYWWYVAKLPVLDSKHHIVKYEGVIQEGHEGLVHHMEVFHCEVGINEIVRDYNGPGEAEGKMPELSACRKVLGAWAMGAKPLSMPKEAGIPIGGEDFSRYVMLEVHYNNPGRLSGVIDSSGIRFYVTSQLRQYDAGVMELGLEYTNKMAIPPRQELFPLTGYCIGKCTETGLPDEGIRIYASQLHTHLTGRKVYTKHIRKGTELPELNRDNHYSPHFQEIRQLPVPVHILPGDELITTCEYGTANKDVPTIGGFAISDEMCVNYVHYYPLVKLEVCKSSVDTRSLHNFFSFMNRWNDDTTSATIGDRDNYNSIRWTKMTSMLLNTMYMTSPISMQCNQSDGTRFPGIWNGIYPTRTYEQLDPGPRDCQ